jgi:phosphoglycerol transferase
MVATQCGVPLLPNGLRNRNRFEAQTAFLPSQTCLSDVLTDHDYDSAFVVGASAAFAGQNHFLRSHHYARIIDSAVISEWYDPVLLAHAIAPRAKAYDDQLTFDVAARHYDEMVAGTAPFAMSIMTYGPHGESGVLSRHCAQDGRARLEPDLRKTVPCTISDLLPFLDHIRANRGDRPTLVAVMSDHLNHKRDVSAQAARMNTVTFLGLGMRDFPAQQLNDRPAAMIDVYPTLLALLGFSDVDVSAGLGQSVLGTTPTLVERHGIAAVDRALETSLDLRLALWQ